MTGLDSDSDVALPHAHGAPTRAAPEVLVTRDERASATIRAATLREAAVAVGVELGPETAVTLNGLSLSTDGEPPLVVAM